MTMLALSSRAAPRDPALGKIWDESAPRLAAFPGASKRGRTDDIEAARREVERILGVQLHMRDGAWGYDYSNWPAVENSVKLPENWFDHEDGVKAADFDEPPLVLQLHRPTNLPVVEAALSASSLLRAERVPDSPDPPPGYWDAAED